MEETSHSILGKYWPNSAAHSSARGRDRQPFREQRKEARCHRWRESRVIGAGGATHPRIQGRRKSAPIRKFSTYVLFLLHFIEDVIIDQAIVPLIGNDGVARIIEMQPIHVERIAAIGENRVVDVH